MDELQREYIRSGGKPIEFFTLRGNMSAALDTEQCVGCEAVQICTRWNPAGTWDYTKGIEPCRPVPEQCPIIDAEQVQRYRYKLRDLK